MGEAHDAVADVDDLGALGLRQRVVARHRVNDGQGRLAHRCGDREGAARDRRQVVQPGFDERVERHRQPLAGLQVQRSRLHRAPELEREERVPARELVHVMEDRAGGHPAEPELQQALDGAEAERGQVEAIEAIGGPVEAERRRRGARRPLREQEADGLVRQAPCREGEHRRGGPVEPLHVVDGDDERRGARQRAQRGQGGERDGLLVRRRAGIRDEQRRLERAPLRGGEVVQRLGVGAEQVAERRVREARLRLGGTGGDRPHARRLRACDRRLPQRRLADARLARDEQRSRARPVEEPLHELQLLVPSDELGLHGGGGRAYPGSIRATRGPRRTRRCARRRSPDGRARTSRACPCRPR